jgi:hypothetical protein
MTAVYAFAAPLAETFGELVRLAKTDDVSARTAPRGSMDELMAIHEFITLRRPSLADAFLDWCTARSELDGFTANGIHMEVEQAEVTVNSRTLLVV